MKSSLAIFQNSLKLLLQSQEGSDFLNLLLRKVVKFEQILLNFIKQTLQVSCVVQISVMRGL